MKAETEILERLSEQSLELVTKKQAETVLNNFLFHKAA
jgi:hypothetical protein